MKHIVEAVQEMEKITSNLSLLKLKLSSYKDTPVYAFFHPVEARTFIGEEIEFVTRQEMVAGSMELVLTDITLKKIVQTLSSDDNIKLYSEDSRLNLSNVVFSEINVNEPMYGAKVYCLKSKFRTSPRSEWCQMTIMDSKGRIAELRNFGERGSSDEDPYGGSYIVCHITKGDYGFQTSSVVQEEIMDLGRHPEIVIAINYLEKIVETDPTLKEFCDGTNFLNILANYISTLEPERGYIAVKLASQVRLAHALTDTTPTLNLTTLTRGLFASLAYVLTNTDNSPRSLSLQSLLSATKYKLGKDLRIQNILEDTPQKILAERTAIKKIVELVNYTSELRLGLNEDLLHDNLVWK